jgi:tetratricopeptide (TPR) repeat protein
MKEFVSLLFRAVLVAVCCFAIWMSVRHARADLAASSGTTAGLQRALQIEPENVELVVSDALLKGDSDDPSPAADEPLLHALRMDPLNSRLLIALGLRAEFRGDNAAAERYLERAAQADHAFLPAWTLANFCVREGQPDKFWPLAQHCLNLDPLLIDPRPVFDLAWRVSSDPRKIRSILPQAGPRLIDYLFYLMGTNRADPAVELWPETLDALDPSQAGDVELVLAYCDFLARSNRMPNAVRAWNESVERKFLLSGRLDPATGVSIADPDFSFPPAKGLFGWRLAAADGVYVTSGASALRFELDGSQPEALALLSTTAAVLPARIYRLRWKDDASQLSSPQDPGFEVRILQQPGNAVTVCAPLLKTEAEGTCPFTAGPGIQRVDIEVRYARAPGTTRPHGTLVISEIRLEFAS